MATLSIPSYRTPGFAEQLNPSLLHERYVQRNQGHPLKMKVLQVQEIDTHFPLNKQRIQSVLQAWKQLSEAHLQSCDIEMKALARGSEKYTQMSQESKLFEGSKNILLRMLQVLCFTNPQATVVVDEKNVFQAISYGHPDELRERTWKIEYLATAPHNIRGTRNKVPEVEGAGTLLIEAAIAQVAKDQQMTLNLKELAIILQAVGDSIGFYDKLHFQLHPTSRDDLSNRILTGDHLIQFLTEYGGRVASVWDEVMRMAA